MDRKLDLNEHMKTENSLYEAFKDIGALDTNEYTPEIHNAFKDETKKRFGKAYDFNVTEKNLINFKLLEW